MRKSMIFTLLIFLLLPFAGSARQHDALAGDDTLTAKGAKTMRNPNIEFYAYGGYALGYTRFTADYYRVGQALSYRKGLTSMSAFGAAIELKITNDFNYSAELLPSVLFDYRFFPLKTRISPYIKANIGYMIDNSFDAAAGFGVILPLRRNKGIVIEALLGTFFFDIMDNHDVFNHRVTSASSVCFNIGYKF
ncbi:MAG: hypothetical protein KUL83_07880 [Lentimicrobium sp.]|nr:hypothetical protein [Lentimicrobium sp.]MDD2527105.1 hypothetical protein [Lentimicrobiaceae bacterium]MDD4597860.1 hypothetical protein [Lentimicrobiaceae bacterium]MDY0025036.1 hypothetical protein [Lentimicrobium sp.]